MALKLGLEGIYKTGKSFLGLSMAEVGPIYSQDNEDGQGHYLEPVQGGLEHQIGQSKIIECKLRQSVIDTMKLESNFSIYWHPNELMADARLGLEWAAKHEKVIGVFIDSGTLLWEDAQELSYNQVTGQGKPLEGALMWYPAKRWWKKFQKQLKASNKHTIMSSHSKQLFIDNKPVKGATTPDVEKTTPHWWDFLLNFEWNRKLTDFPIATLMGRDGGLFLKDGNKIESPTFKKLLDWLPQAIAPDYPILSTSDILYRNLREGGISDEGKFSPRG